MSSSNKPSNDSRNNDSRLQNQSLNYDINELVNSQMNHQQQIPDYDFDHLGESNEHHIMDQIESNDYYAYEESPNDYDVELAQPNRVHAVANDEEDSVFSDAVQDAFSKYQNEQEELFAQMEECWSYMMSQPSDNDTPKASIEQRQNSSLNPDAVEFKPSWLTSPPTTTNEGSPVISTSNQSEEPKKDV